MFCDQVQLYCFIKKFSVFFIIFSGPFTGINSMPGRFYIRRRQIITPLSDQMFTHSCFTKHLFLICLFHLFKEIIGIQWKSAGNLDNIKSASLITLLDNDFCT